MDRYHVCDRSYGTLADLLRGLQPIPMTDDLRQHLHDLADAMTS